MDGQTDRPTDRRACVALLHAQGRHSECGATLQSHGGGLMHGRSARGDSAEARMSLLISAAAGIRGGDPRCWPGGLKHGLKQYQWQSLPRDGRAFNNTASS